jgi:xylan 1,4-beta-xylosidase
MKKRLLCILMLLSLFSHAQLEKKTERYRNPILAGNYADPSILRDGEMFYMVHSSFLFYPGLLIWQSRNLVDWKPVTHALQKNLGAVWAPDLVKYKNKFYIYFPANNTNYVVTADSIGGPWSEPIDLKIGNIDPGHIADEKGNRYLYFNDGYYAPLSADGLSITGKAQKVYEGWDIPRNWRIECFCLEGPKLFKRGEYYYLTVAEGGTAGPATSHMVVSARSKSPLGPWENSPYNPIIRTKDQKETWWSKGHGTLVDDIQGKWWIVFHGYENSYYNLGRQTLLEPIEWTKDGWFRSPEKIFTDQEIRMPAGKKIAPTTSLSDNFENKKLGWQWQFFQEYDSSRISFEKGALVLKSKGNSVGNSLPMTLLTVDHSYEATVELEVENGATAALVLFYNDRAYSGIGVDSSNYYGILRGWQFSSDRNTGTNHTYLKLKNMDHTVDMFYSSDGISWTKFQSSLEVSSLNHNVMGDFLSLRIGLVAMGNGRVKFHDFTYKALPR